MRFEQAWLLAFSVALIPLAWVPAMPVAGAQLSDVVGAAGVGLALVSLRGRLPPRGALALAVGFAGWAVVSTFATHGSPMRLLGYLWIVVYGLGVAIYASESDVLATRMRRSLVIAAVIGAVTGLVGALLFAFHVWTPLLNHAGDLVPGNYPRIRGTMMRANALAGVLATGLVLAAGEVPRRPRSVVMALLGLALGFTFSRSWIALCGAAAVYVLALGERRSRGRDAAAIAVVVVCTAAMLASAWLGLRLDPTRPWDVSLTDEPGTRWLHLQAALDTIAEHPLFGVGPGGMADPTGWDAHFSLANVAAILGVPAALAYVGLVGYAVTRAVRAARRNAAARGIAAALVLFALDALARDIEDQRVLWVLIGLSLALPRREPGD